MAIKTLVLDFDGTFTDVEQEAAPFHPEFRSLLSDLLGRDVTDEWERARVEIENAPEQHGWVFAGKVVAPATADPYLLGTAIVQSVFDRAGVLKGATLRTEISQALYKLAYQKTRTAFAEGAREVLADVAARVDLSVFVVTNSDTHAVAKKLETLLPGALRAGHVRGDAKKFWVTEPDSVDELFGKVPETVRLGSLPRPVYLRRGKYYEALARIWNDTMSSPAETLVCGDIYELDLALPAALGTRIALAPRRNTLAYEKEATLAANGTVLGSLKDLLGLLGGP